jgi:hypothetical protein
VSPLGRDAQDGGQLGRPEPVPVHQVKDLAVAGRQRAERRQQLSIIGWQGTESVEYLPG